MNLRDVPDEVYTALAQGAEASRQSLSAFVIERLAEVAQTLGIASYLASYEPPRSTGVTLDDAAAAVRATRVFAGSVPRVRRRAGPSGAVFGPSTRSEQARRHEDGEAAGEPTVCGQAQLPQAAASDPAPKAPISSVTRTPPSVPASRSCCRYRR
jgi:hypothetical protein